MKLSLMKYAHYMNTEKLVLTLLDVCKPLMTTQQGHTQHQYPRYPHMLPAIHMSHRRHI